MAKLITNSFSSYALSEDEEVEGSKLTITQKQVIQNQLAITSEELINLKLDPDNFQKFLQDQAFKQGYIAALQYQLELSASIEELEKARNNS